MDLTCCFTGHRDLPKADSAEYAALMLALERAVSDAVRAGCRRFLVGGAKGFDLLAGEWILALKKVDPSISLLVYIPYRAQASAFPPADRARYQTLLSEADEALCLSETYHPGCLRERNARMVQDADYCIAYVRRSRSGSGQTMQMAEAKGLTVLRI
ncbi:MAG: DUF1273 family protein [Clostridia bacterium]|nr:DUF1273 family protein [Clostridia bacterium]